MVFIAVSLIVTFVGFLRLIVPSVSSLILTILLFFSGGMIIAIDRGNLQLLVAGMAIWFCIGFLEKRPKMVVTALVIAVAIKLYFALLVIVLLRAKRWKEAIVAGVVSVLVYLFGFLILAGSDVPHSVSTFIKTEGLFASSPKSEFVLGCVSAASVVYKSLFLIWGPAHFTHFLSTSPTWLIQLPGLAMAGVCLAIVWLDRYPREIGLIAVLSMLQLVPASTYPYLQVNLAIELCLVLRLLARPAVSHSGDAVDGDHPSGMARSILVLSAVLLAIGCAPWMGLLHGNLGASTPVVAYVGPITNIVVLLLLLTGLLRIRRDSRRRARTDGRAEVKKHRALPAS
jgi:hypothetical protein